ncbi:MAG: DUF5367 family protein [Chloroflexi bacterium]|nr:DUF5367 family protein [Chloroflexota bacterium]
MNRRLFFGIGFAIWLLATIVFRLLGHLIFLHEEPPVLALIWLATVIALAAVAWLLFRWQRLGRAQRFEAAVLLVISGMVLDAFITEAFADVFPNMSAGAAASFGAWLLLAYASVLLTPFLPAGADQGDST